MPIKIDWRHNLLLSLRHAARDAHERLNLARGDFLKLADDAWDDENTEAGQARMAEERHKAHTKLIAWLDDPARIAEQQAIDAREQAEQDAAEAARPEHHDFPCLRRLGHVARVFKDGRVWLGTLTPEGFVMDRGAFVSLVETCDACPEQYDAFIAERKIGYLRLRHGVFRVDYDPDGNTESIYYTCTYGDGRFNADERHHHLDRARAALYERYSEDH